MHLPFGFWGGVGGGLRGGTPVFVLVAWLGSIEFMTKFLRVNLVVASMYVNRAEVLAQPRSWDADDWVLFSEYGIVIRCLVEP